MLQPNGMRRSGVVVDFSFAKSILEHARRRFGQVTGRGLPGLKGKFFPFISRSESRSRNVECVVLGFGIDGFGSLHHSLLPSLQVGGRE